MPVSPLVVTRKMLRRPHFSRQHAHHEKRKLSRSFREHVGSVSERDLVTVGVGAVDVVETDGNLRHYLQTSLARLEYFGVNGVAQGGNQTVDAGFHFLDNQALGWRFGTGIDLNVISPFAQQIDGFPNITGGKNAEFCSHRAL